MQEQEHEHEHEHAAKLLLRYYWPGTQEEFDAAWPDIYRHLQEQSACYIAQENEKRRQARSTRNAHRKHSQNAY